MLCWGYPPGSIFASHYDSRYNWGEVRCGAAFFAATLHPRSQARAAPAFAQYVAGVSLGAPCEIVFVENRTGKRVPPKGARKVRIILP